MSENIYTTSTASLKATVADIRTINSKRIKIGDKNILDYIKDSEFKNYDTRDPQLKNDELDIWNTEISLSDNGHIEVKPFEHTVDDLSDEQKHIINCCKKITNNEVFGENDDYEMEHKMYWQTDGLVTSGYYLFEGFNGAQITTFESDLTNLTNGEEMFFYCHELTSFKSNLSNLLAGVRMFVGCQSLTSFDSNLPKLTDGNSMFCACSNLTSFSSDLSNLIGGYDMFYDCENLTSFSSNLSSLADSERMFKYCENLTSFKSDLSSLIRGYEMFNGCKLDASSVANIVHTLPTIEETVENITIGIGCDDTEEDQLLFAQECDCETWQELLDEFSAKNWSVYFECNGRPTTTYNMRRGETLPIYAKLVEVIMPTDENEHKPYYQYTSVDGSKFYNIRHFHSTNGSTEGYDVFSSLEEAISTYNVTPKN